MQQPRSSSLTGHSGPSGSERPDVRGEERLPHESGPSGASGFDLSRREDVSEWLRKTRRERDRAAASDGRTSKVLVLSLAALLLGAVFLWGGNPPRKPVPRIATNQARATAADGAGGMRPSGKDKPAANQAQPLADVAVQAGGNKNALTAEGETSR